MKTWNNWFPIFLSAFLLIGFIVFLIFFSPIQLGGQTAYIVIYGNSMEPDFHSGDLIITKHALEYQIGDLVAYRNKDLNNYVFHRIIGQNNDRYILQGYNNPNEDSYHPYKSEIVGKYWFQMQQMGAIIQNLRIPASFILAAILSYALWSILMKNESKKGNKKRIVPIQYWGIIIEAFSLIFMILLIFSLGLCLFSFSRPLIISVKEPFQYEHSGTFFYSANVPPGLYDSTLLHDGDPIFPKLSCEINIGFGYYFAGIPANNMQGTYQITAKILDDQSGWVRNFLVSQAVPFTGDYFVSNSMINLCQIEEYIDTIEKATGLFPSYYLLNITPRIEVSGLFNGQTFSDYFEPSLVFRFDKLHFYLNRAGGELDPLNTIKTSSVLISKTKANSVSFLDWIIDIYTLRAISLIILFLSSLWLIILIRFICNIKDKSQEEYIKLKYSSLLINARKKDSTGTISIIKIDTIDELAKLAEKFDTYIFYRKDATNHYYTVHSNDRIYEFSYEEKEQSI